MARITTTSALATGAGTALADRGGLMANRHGLFSAVILALVVGGLIGLSRSAVGQTPSTQPPRRPRDAVADAQTPKDVPAERPEQKKTAHDLSDVFTPSKASPSSEAVPEPSSILLFGAVLSLFALISYRFRLNYKLK